MNTLGRILSHQTRLQRDSVPVPLSLWPIDNSSTGVYFLRVIPLVPANSNPYEFYLQLHNNYDLIGSNFYNAREFTDALSVTGKINYVCDQEYFKITLSESGSYVLASPLGSNFIIHLYD